jgi:pSer/pThr/pTyr-binding forkhead associated (FHA) protein
MALQVKILTVEGDDISIPEVSVYNKDKITIGRFLNNDLVLNDTAVSAAHLQVRVEEEQSQIFVTDLASTNGTVVNGKKLIAGNEVLVGVSDRLVIGNYILKFDILTGAIAETKTNGAAVPNRHIGEDTMVLTRDDLVSIFHKNQLEEDLLEEGLKVESKELELKEDIKTEIKAEVKVEQDIEQDIAPENDDLEIDFEARKLIRIRGVVRHHGVALAGVKISSPKLGETCTNQNGEYSFDNVPEDDSYELSAEKDGFIFAKLIKNS